MQRPREYASLFVTLKYYQAPYCCKCNQPKGDGREYDFAFNYGAASPSASGGTTLRSTQKGEGTAYLCHDCRSVVLREAIKLHVPIMGAVILIPSLLAYLFDPRDMLSWVVMGGLIAFLYYFIGLRSDDPERIYRKSIWKCIRYKALAHGCPPTITTSGGHVLYLQEG
jgi:hypothetical protein